MSSMTFDCVHIIDGFIDVSSLEEVNQIIAYGDYGVNISKAQGEDGYRTLGFSENLFDVVTKYSPPSIILKPHENFPIKKVFDPIMLKMHQTIQHLWGRDLFLETDYSILGYRVGESLKAHHDGIYNLKTNSGHPRRDVSSVLYLNDDYEGGELNFVNQKLKIKPKAGTVVLFPSTEKFVHYTNKVVSNIKFFIPSLWCFK